MSFRIVTEKNVKYICLKGRNKNRKEEQNQVKHFVN